MHGGALTALTPDAARRLGAADQPALGMILQADAVILRNTELSWIGGIMCEGAQAFWATKDMLERAGRAAGVCRTPQPALAPG